MMLSQRARGGVIRVKNKSSNGPPRAQSKVAGCRSAVKGLSQGCSSSRLSGKGQQYGRLLIISLCNVYRVFCDVKAYVSSREHDSALLKVRSLSAKQGGTTDKYIRP